MRAFLILVVVLGLIAATVGGQPGASSAASDAWAQICATGNVEPGIGIGSIKLGNSFVGTVTALGTPASMDGTSNMTASLTDLGWQRLSQVQEGAHGQAAATFGAYPRDLFLHAKNDAIDIISTTGLDCHDNGQNGANQVGLATPWTTARGVYGLADATIEQEGGIVLVYNSIGLYLLITLITPSIPDGSVAGLSVFPAHRFCDAVGKNLCAKFSPPLH